MQSLYMQLTALSLSRQCFSLHGTRDVDAVPGHVPKSSTYQQKSFQAIMFRDWPFFLRLCVSAAYSSIVTVFILRQLYKRVVVYIFENKPISNLL